tara:strand:+ start:2309 stop:3118 length:810 start_codon:yes stop_codon:yes gene_type:complete
MVSPSNADVSKSYTPFTDYTDLNQRPDLPMNRDLSLQEMTLAGAVLMGSYRAMVEISDGVLVARSLSEYGTGSTRSTTTIRRESISSIVERKTESLIDELKGPIKNRGQEVGLVRRIKGVSSKQLADRLGVKVGQITAYEQGDGLNDARYTQIMEFLLPDVNASTEAVVSANGVVPLDEYLGESSQLARAAQSMLYTFIDVLHALKDNPESLKKFRETVPESVHQYLLLISQPVIRANDPELGALMGINSVTLDGRDTSGLEFMVRDKS